MQGAKPSSKESLSFFEFLHNQIKFSAFGTFFLFLDILGINIGLLYYQALPYRYFTFLNKKVNIYKKNFI